MFSIKSIYALNFDNSFGGYPWKVVVSVTMPSKEWTDLKKKGALGQLYGIEISNYVYALNNNIPAHCPTVDDSQRAKKGIKTVELTYFLSSNQADKAEALGLKVIKLKNGEVCAESYDCVKVG